MDFPFKREEWKTILIHLYKRAAEDHQYHLLCLTDPHLAIKLISGREISKKFKLRFEEQRPDEIIVILPLENKVLLKELKDHDLESMASGMAAVSAPFAE